MRGDLLGLGFDLLERLHHRREADRPGARAIGAHAELHLVSIAVNHADVLDRDAEAIGDDLRKRRLMALTMLMRAGENLDRTGRIDADLSRLPQADAGAERTDRGARRDAASLNVSREAKAAQLAVPCRLPLALA